MENSKNSPYSDTYGRRLGLISSNYRKKTARPEAIDKQKKKKMTVLFCERLSLSANMAIRPPIEKAKTHKPIQEIIKLYCLPKF